MESALVKNGRDSPEYFIAGKLRAKKYGDPPTSGKICGSNGYPLDEPCPACVGALVPTHPISVIAGFPPQMHVANYWLDNQDHEMHAIKDKNWILEIRHAVALEDRELNKFLKEVGVDAAKEYVVDLNIVVPHHVRREYERRIRIPF